MMDALQETFLRMTMRLKTNRSENKFYIIFECGNWIVTEHSALIFCTVQKRGKKRSDRSRNNLTKWGF